jgi:hypothetical protein
MALDLGHHAANAIQVVEFPKPLRRGLNGRRHCHSRGHKDRCGNAASAHKVSTIMNAATLTHLVFRCNLPQKRRGDQRERYSAR